MTELVNDSTDRSHDAAAYAANLMRHYGFDLNGEAIAPLLFVWLEQYPASWIRLATIEALYQGRYKAISVEQILALWQRRSQPVYHFNHEFERLICDRLPQPLAPPVSSIQEEPLSMRSAQAMVAHLPYKPVVLPHSNFKATPLKADAMQALRTLHDTTAHAPLADSSLESSAEPNKPSMAQTYSYTVRSNTVRSDTVRSQEPLSKTSINEPHEPLLQSHVDPSLPSTLLPLDPAASVLTISDETLQAQSIASTDVRSSSVQSQETNLPADASSPMGDSMPMSSTTPQAASIARILQQLDNQELVAKAMFPGIGLLAQTLQPKLHPTARYQPIWLTDVSNQPIHQFTPVPEASDFHTRLKSVAQVPEALPEELPEGESCDPLSQG